MKYALLIFSLFCHQLLPAQTDYPIPEDILETTAEELETAPQELPMELLDLGQRKLDINSNDRELLLTLHLLTDQQLRTLEEYISRMGPLVELEELQQVEAFGKKDIQRLLPYCFASTSKKIPARHQLTIRWQQVIGEENPGSYSGSMWKTIVRYKGSVNRWKFFVTSEKDPGEKLWTSGMRGLDYNSLCISYTGHGWLRKIIAGDYHVEAGQGLALWTGLSFMGGQPVTAIYKHGRGIIESSGTDENRFMRGTAASLQLRNWKTDAWFSSHAVDANIDSGYFPPFATSLQRSGYHRTASEMDDRHSIRETSMGANIRYENKMVSAGILFHSIHYNLPLILNSSPYGRFRFAGRTNTNASAYYSHTLKNVHIFGELATDEEGETAWLAGLIVLLDSRLSLGFSSRSYSKGYTALQGNAFGANSDNANETGQYLAVCYRLSRSLTYSVSMDLQQFPFSKYTIDLPSVGQDIQQQVDFLPNKKVSMQVKYKYRLKQTNVLHEDEHLHALADICSHSLRFGSRFKLENGWEMGIRGQITIQSIHSRTSSRSTMLSHELFYKPLGKRYSLNFRYAIFHCPDFDTRIYSYENDVPGSFSVPFYYGSGNRFYLNVNLRIAKGLNASIRYSLTILDGDEKKTSEIKIQIRKSWGG